MKKYTIDYIRKAMKFNNIRIELTEQQRNFLRGAYQELQDRIDTIHMDIGQVYSHQESSLIESLRLCTKSVALNNIITTGGYTSYERTLLLKLRNYHLNRL